MLPSIRKRHADSFIVQKCIGTDIFHLFALYVTEYTMLKKKKNSLEEIAMALWFSKGRPIFCNGPIVDDAGTKLKIKLCS